MDHHQRVVVTGVRIPFWDMVSFLVTLAIAAIPALVILTVFFAAIGAVLAMVVAA